VIKMRYSTEIDKEKDVSLFGRELKISPKSAREVCKELVGKRSEDAEKYLEEVIGLRQPVRYTRYVGKAGHKSGYGVANYPVKVCKEILKLIKECRANGESKGLDGERLVIKHASAYRGRKIKGYIPRAHGKSSAHNEETTNMELIMKEIEE
jgi:ribosomal protein L22(archaeal)/L17(eukaryotic/archaeal)